MALAHFQRTFTDASGNVKPGLSVTVRRESDNGLAALFADAGSVTPKSNPFNTDANGYGSFYVTDGRYRIQATDIDWRDTDIFISPTFYAQLAGGPLANFTAMPQVGGDPIVESGSNADGEWTRWADGTQVVYGRVQRSIAISTSFGSFFRNASFESDTNLPLSFLVADYVLTVVRQEDSILDPEDIGVFQVFPESTGAFAFFLLSETNQMAAIRGYSFHAVGRWK